MDKRGSSTEVPTDKKLTIAAELNRLQEHILEASKSESERLRKDNKKLLSISENLLKANKEFSDFVKTLVSESSTQKLLKRQLQIMTKEVEKQFYTLSEDVSDLAVDIDSIMESGESDESEYDYFIPADTVTMGQNSIYSQLPQNHYNQQAFFNIPGMFPGTKGSLIKKVDKINGINPINIPINCNAHYSQMVENASSNTMANSSFLNEMLMRQQSSNMPLSPRIYSPGLTHSHIVNRFNFQPSSPSNPKPQISQRLQSSMIGFPPFARNNDSVCEMPRSPSLNLNTNPRILNLLPQVPNNSTPTIPSISQNANLILPNFTSKNPNGDRVTSSIITNYVAETLKKGLNNLSIPVNKDASELGRQARYGLEKSPNDITDHSAAPSDEEFLRQIGVEVFGSKMPRS